MRLSSLSDNRVHYKSISSNHAKFKQIQSKISEIYNKSYKKIVPGSIKYLEYSLKHTPKHKSPLKSSLSPESPNSNLSHDHLSLKFLDSELKIIDLPKSPFGRHITYNDKNNFIQRHFISNDSPNCTTLQKIKKKIGLISKKVNKHKQYYDATKSSSKSYLLNHKNSKDYDIFNTVSGLLICKKNQDVMKIYEKETEKFKTANKFEKKNSSDLNSKILELNPKTKIRDLSHVVNRLYPVSPKPIISFIDRNKKFKKLFEEEVLKI
jgi:hypothetical protein